MGYPLESPLILGVQMNPESRTMLPKVAFTGFASRYREPTREEGLGDIVKVDFEVRNRAARNFMMC